MPSCRNEERKMRDKYEIAEVIRNADEWDPDDCREVIYRFGSERRAGEMSKIRNLPALLTRLLSMLPDRKD